MSEATTFGLPNKWWRTFGSAFGFGSLPGSGNPEKGIQASGGGGPIEADVAVTDERAMQVSTVWSCVRLITETVGSLPLDFKRVVKGGERVDLEPDHYIVTLLKHRPNALMNALEWREATAACVVLWGNGYSVIDWSGDRIVSLSPPLRPDRMDVHRLGGELTYHYTHDGGVKVYAARSILHIKAFSTDGVMGLSPLAYARQVLGVSISTDKYASKTFARGGRPSGILTFDKFLNQAQRVDAQRMYDNLVAGDNSGAPLILEGGTKYEAIGISPDDMQMLQSRAFNVSEIARIFRVPSHMVNDSEKSTTYGTGIEEINLGFLGYTIRPYLTRTEACYRDSLLTAVERDVVVVEHNVEGLLRTNSTTRAGYYSQLLQNGVMNRNEVRRKENLPLIDGGDKFTVQSNLVDLTKLGTMPAAQTPTNAGIATDAPKQ